MSLLTRLDRISVKPFASVPSLANLPSIQPPQASVSNVSSRGAEEGVDFSEGYFHQTHTRLVLAANASLQEDLLEEVLCVTPECSLSINLENTVRSALGLYAFIAVTASLSTLNDLIEIVQSDNNRRQLAMHDRGIDIRCSLDFNRPRFTKPEYELVALHPEHFLPLGSMLTVYDPGTSPHPSSPRLPALHRVSEDREPMGQRLNVFLVIINAEIKFRRYFAMAQPTTSLPADVINLMYRTMNLVRLLYWKSVPEKRSRGEEVVAKRLAGWRKNPPRAKRLDPAKAIGRVPSEDGQEMQIPSSSHVGSSRRSRLRWLADVNLETRMAYGKALMSGHDREYDPALFEDAILINDSPLRKRL
ncbi:hypothetical protein AX15_002227 [Amanita polypyramis BW_CC]|nr:hypothetical protein AX15_002227 [Amanita polypyramis BW_CC]